MGSSLSRNLSSRPTESEFGRIALSRAFLEGTRSSRILRKLPRRPHQSLQDSSGRLLWEYLHHLFANEAKARTFSGHCSVNLCVFVCRMQGCMLYIIDFIHVHGPQVPFICVILFAGCRVACCTSSISFMCMDHRARMISNLKSTCLFGRLGRT
jgi:hypothetical protein